MISVIILQHNNTDLTRDALRSFLAHHDRNFEIILVDNASAADPDPLRREFPSVTLIKNKQNVGFGAANNQAAFHAKGDILFFLNNDTIIQSEILSAIGEMFETRQEIGIIGPKLLNKDGTFQISAGALPTFWSEIGDKMFYGMVRRRSLPALHYAERRHSKAQTVGWVTGAALFVRRSLFLRLGGFDHEMFMYFEDKDLCNRVKRAGFSVVYYPEVSLVHVKGSSSLGDNPDQLHHIYRESQLRYYAMHRPVYERLLLNLYLYSMGKYPH